MISNKQVVLRKRLRIASRLGELLQQENLMLVPQRLMLGYGSERISLNIKIVYREKSIECNVPESISIVEYELDASFIISL